MERNYEGIVSDLEEATERWRSAVDTYGISNSDYNSGYMDALSRVQSYIRYALMSEHEKDKERIWVENQRRDIEIRMRALDNLLEDMEA